MIASAPPQWDVALSFAGEQRQYVERVASSLAAGGFRVFYDRHEQVELWGKNVFDYLDYVYRIAARYCVIFVSKEYAAKAWTNHERQSAQARALDESSEYLLPVRFDDTPLDGLRPTVAFLDARQSTPEAVASAIAQKIGGSGGGRVFESVASDRIGPRPPTIAGSDLTEEVQGMLRAKVASYFSSLRAAEAWSPEFVERCADLDTVARRDIALADAHKLRAFEFDLEEFMRVVDEASRGWRWSASASEVHPRSALEWGQFAQHVDAVGLVLRDYADRMQKWSDTSREPAASLWEALSRIKQYAWIMAEMDRFAEDPALAPSRDQSAAEFVRQRASRRREVIDTHLASGSSTYFAFVASTDQIAAFTTELDKFCSLLRTVSSLGESSSSAERERMVAKIAKAALPLTAAAASLDETFRQLGGDVR